MSIYISKRALCKGRGRNNSGWEKPYNQGNGSKTIGEEYSPSDQIPKVPGFFRISNGLYGEVWLADKDKILLDNLAAASDQTSKTEMNTLNRTFRTFSDEGPGKLTDKLKYQTRVRSSNGQVGILALKANQYRIYGILSNRGPVKCFVGVATDESKKRNNANANLYRQSAARVADWNAVSQIIFH